MMRITHDHTCFYVADAVKNAIIACFLSVVLGADLILLILIKHGRAFNKMIVPSGLGIVLVVLIAYLIYEIHLSLNALK